MKNVIIVGSGAVAAELTSYIQDNNKFCDEESQLNILGYLEYEENIPNYWAKYGFEKPVLGNVDHYEVNENEFIIIGISNIIFRAKMMAVIQSKGAGILGFVHHSAIISSSAKIGRGNIIYPHCIIGPNAVLGDNNLITAYSFISHDCKVGSDNFMASAGLSGNVTVGNGNYFGIRSTVLPNISLGNRNKIQAGMIVDKKVNDDCIVFHRFKEKIIATNNLIGNE